MPPRSLLLAVLALGCHRPPPQAPVLHSQLLAGNGVDCTRDRADGWSLSVGAGTVELMWCGSGAGADLADAVRRTLGEPSSGACWNVCSWTSPEATLVHHSTRTVRYDVLTFVIHGPRDR